MPEGKKTLEVPVVIGGDDLPSPSWNKVNLSAKYWGATLAGTDLLCMLNWGTQWTMVSYLKK